MTCITPIRQLLIVTACVATLTADLRADWTLSPSATLWLALDNAFDEEVEVSETASGVAGFGPPRVASVGIRLSR